jgi:hypothetical protein
VRAGTHPRLSPLPRSPLLQTLPDREQPLRVPDSDTAFIYAGKNYGGVRASIREQGLNDRRVPCSRCVARSFAHRKAALCRWVGAAVSEQGNHNRNVAVACSVP